MFRITLISIIFLLSHQIVQADVFQVKSTEYFKNILYWSLLDIGNNFAEDIFQEDLSDEEVANLKRSDIPFFDRWIDFQPEQKYKNLSDYTYAGLLGTSLILTSSRDEMKDNYMVLSQILLMQSALGKWVKTFTTRKRPYVYFKGKVRKNQNSFYSLHSSGAFAIATYTYYYKWVKNGGNPILAVLLYGGASLTAVLRVAAAQHFPSDVITGAIAGSALSYLVCRSYLHTRIRLSISSNQLGIGLQF